MSQSQAADTRPRVLIFKTLDTEEVSKITSAFSDSCGGKFKLDELDMNGNLASGLPLLTQRMESFHPNLVFSLGAASTRLVADNYPKIPVFYNMIANPEESLAKYPDVKGVTFRCPIKTQLEVMKKIVPSLKIVGTVLNIDRAAYLLAEFKSACKSLDLQPVFVPFLKSEDVYEYMQELYDKKVDLLLILPDNSFFNNASSQGILRETLRKKLPTLMYSRVLVGSGFLLSVQPDLTALGKQSADMVSQLLLEKKALDEEFYYPLEYKIAINGTTAQKLGLKIPEDLSKEAELL